MKWAVRMEQRSHLSPIKVISGDSGLHLYLFLEKKVKIVNNSIYRKLMGIRVDLWDSKINVYRNNNVDIYQTLKWLFFKLSFEINN